MITQVSYERVFNLGSYESERISAVATVEDGDLDAAFYEARMAVEYEHTRTVSDRKVAQATQPAQPNDGASFSPPASDKQRAFIASLQDRLGWTSEQMGAYASEQGVDLVGMNRSQASALIDGLQKFTREEGIVRWAEKIVTPASTEDIPF